MSQDAAPAPVPQTGAIVRLARFVLAHRRLVVVLWLLLLPAGIYGASHVSNRLKVDFSLPGQPGYETAKKITHLYGNGGDVNPTVVLVTLPPGHAVGRERRQLAHAFDAARGAVPRDRIVDYAATGDPSFITGRGRSTFALLFTRPGKGFGGPAIPDALGNTLSAALPPGTQIRLHRARRARQRRQREGSGRVRRDADRRRSARSRCSRSCSPRCSRSCRC